MISSVTAAIFAGVFFWGAIVFFKQKQEICPCTPQKKHCPSFLYHSLSASVMAFDKLTLVSMALDIPPLHRLNSPWLLREKNGFLAFFSAKKAWQWGLMLVKIACLLHVDNFHCSQFASCVTRRLVRGLSCPMTTTPSFVAGLSQVRPERLIEKAGKKRSLGAFGLSRDKLIYWLSQA